jgi:amino acid permease
MDASRPDNHIKVHPSGEVEIKVTHGLSAKVSWLCSVLIQLALAGFAQWMAAIVYSEAEAKWRGAIVVKGAEKKPPLHYYSPFTKFSVWVAPYLLALAVAGAVWPWLLSRKGKEGLFTLSVVSLLIFLVVFCITLNGFALPYVVIRC